MKPSTLLFLSLLSACLLACDNTDPVDRGLVTQTAQGLVTGLDQGDVFSYRGIAYAAPPVGDLRWKRPVPAESWEGVREATQRPEACVQETEFAGFPIPGLQTSEDCLYLNVDTPTEGSDLPVLVWIHGGGFVIGEGLQQDGGTAGDLIARETGTVVVSMNYRLGPFGFLAHPQLGSEAGTGASGNYGLMDQVAALQWVQDNIAAFGGDPSNVTIVGESAGAMSVCSHMASAQSSGLFQKAILQSGSCQKPFLDLSRAESQGVELAAVLGCSEGEDELSCMRAATADDVLAALVPGANLGFGPPSEDTGYWMPVVDGDFFEQQPAETLRSGEFNRVPTLLGFTADETRLFVWMDEVASEAPRTVGAESYESRVLERLGGNEELASKAISEYALDQFSEPSEALSALTTDADFRCPGRLEAQILAEFVPAYAYQFDYGNGRAALQTAIDIGLLDAELPSYGLGAFHTAEIPYVFGYAPGAVATRWPAGSEGEQLWQTMLGYWTRFAATGDPNAEGAVQWPTYDAEAERYLSIDETVTSELGLAQDACAFWEGEPYLTLWNPAHAP